MTDNRLLIFYCDYSSIVELYTEEVMIMQREIEEFGTWRTNHNSQCIEITCVYDDWIMWCLKRPSWAIKFRIGQ